MADQFNLDVLVVDDSATIRMYLESFLKERGCRVQTAENGKAATERLRAFKPDLIFLDFNMPEMDGFTMLRELQTDPDCSRIAIFVLTGKSMEGNAGEMIKLEPNVKAVLAKPTDDRTLIKKLREFATSIGKYVELKGPEEQGAPPPAGETGAFGADIHTFNLKDLEKPAKPPTKPEDKK